MDWYTLYSGDTKLLSVAEIDVAKKVAGPYIQDGLPLEIKRADPVTGRVIDLWRYDYATKNWVAYSGPSFAI